MRKESTPARCKGSTFATRADESLEGLSSIELAAALAEHAYTFSPDFAAALDRYRKGVHRA